MKHTAAKAKAVYAEMASAFDRTPTVAEFAKRLKVSTRTAWRYMGQERHRVKCRHCRGTGYVPNLQSKETK